MLGSVGWLKFSFARFVGIECQGCDNPDSIDTALWACVLFCNLSVRRISGCSFMVG